jgi:hypothetical protein
MSVSMKSAIRQPSAGFKPNTATLELGITRLFGNGDIGVEGMLSGWAAPEENHNWNDGVEATLQLELAASEGAFELAVEGVPLINSKNPSQEITLYANGFRVGYWKLDEYKAQLLTVDVEPEHIFWRGKIGYVKCVWFMPNSVRLSEIQNGDDSRQLAFCFRSILIRSA